MLPVTQAGSAAVVAAAGTLLSIGIAGQLLAVSALGSELQGEEGSGVWN
jgi:hypothetical protein